MTDASRQIQYLHSCYEADNRETVITNLHHKKYCHLRFLSGSEDILYGLRDAFSIAGKAGESAHKEALLL